MLPEVTEICRKIPKFAEICRKMPKNIDQPPIDYDQNVSIFAEIYRYTPKNTEICRNMPNFAVNIDQP